MDKQQLDKLDAELARIAREGTMEEFAGAMLNHPIDGPLVRAFALEGDAPEYEATMRRIAVRHRREVEPGHAIAVAVG
jgi:hypothetical protein